MRPKVGTLLPMDAMSYLRKLVWGTVKIVTRGPTGWRFSVKQQEITSHNTVTSDNKSKATLYRSGEFLISSGGCGSQISIKSAHEKGKAVSPSFKQKNFPNRGSFYSLLKKCW